MLDIFIIQCSDQKQNKNINLKFYLLNIESIS